MPDDALIARLAAVEEELAAFRRYQAGRGEMLDHGGRPEDVAWKLLCSTFVFFMQLGFAMVESGMSTSQRHLDVREEHFGLYFRLARNRHVWLLDRLRRRSAQHDTKRSAPSFTYSTISCTGRPRPPSCRRHRRARLALRLRCPLHLHIWHRLQPCCQNLGGPAAARYSPASIRPSTTLWARPSCTSSAARPPLAGAFVVGPRNGRWDPRKHGDFAPHDVKAVLSGVLILWVAWYGFNPRIDERNVRPSRREPSVAFGADDDRCRREWRGFAYHLPNRVCLAHERGRPEWRTHGD